MTKRIRFEEQAIEQLDDIADWTVETFGARHAQAYEDLLFERFEKLSKGLAHTKPITATDTRRVMRAGEHVVIFSESPSEIIILALLHARADLIRHITDLPPEPKDV